MKLYTLFASLFFGTLLMGQNDIGSSNSTEIYLEQLFSSGKTFLEITEEADQYFQSLYPDLNKKDLCEGEFRDGNYVKYQRWKHFWKMHLNEDGTLGHSNNTSNQVRGLSDTHACTGDEYIANWSNINYVSNMGYQIDQGRTNCIAFHPTDPDIFYVGAAFGGLWKSTDGGQSYSILNDDLPILAVSGIVLDPADPDHIIISLSDILWYGPYGIGIYESFDGGQTFSPTSIDWDITAYDKIYYMDQDPSNAANIIIATNIGLFKTTDFFATNTLVQSGNMRSVKYSFSDPNIVYAGGNQGQFYKSIDGGDSFGLVTDFGNGHVRIAVPRVNNSNNVVATHGTYLERSTDNGTTFETKDIPENNMVVEFQPSSDQVLLFGNFEVFRSDDFGDSTYQVTQWLGNQGLPYIHVDQRNVFVNPYSGNSVYFCNDGGIFAYDFDNESFSNLSTGLVITQYYDIAVSQTEELVLGAGSQDNGNVFRESTGVWDRYAQTGDGMGQDIDPTDANTRYWSYQNGALRRWQSGSNSGIAPPGKGGNGAWETPFKIDPNNSDRIFVGYDSVFVSNDQGNNWTNVGGLLSSGNVEQLAIAPSNSDHLYATKDGLFYEKDGTSGSWIFHPTPVNTYITDLEVDPLNEDIVYISYSGYNDGDKIFRSDDGGANWINITYNLPNLPFMALELYHNVDGGIFVGTYGAVYYMDNSMSEWRKFGCIPNSSVRDIEIQYQTNQIYIGTHGRGIFNADIDFNVASNNETSSTGNTQFLLYPNPARNKVFIKATSGSFSEPVIRVYNLIGEEMESSYHLNGLGEIEIDCRNLSSGHYLVKVDNGSGEITNFKFTLF